MTTVIGLDISSVRLDACLLVPGEPPRLHHEILGKSTEPLIERIRRVPAAIAELCVVWHEHPNEDIGLWGYPDWIVIEQPVGKYGVCALNAILGAITCSVPAESQIAWRKASEWRHDLGAKNTKPAGHEAVWEALANADWPTWIHPTGFDRILNEHELDAIGVALGWARILEGQTA